MKIKSFQRRHALDSGIQAVNFTTVVFRNSFRLDCQSAFLIQTLRLSRNKQTESLVPIFRFLPHIMSCFRRLASQRKASGVIAILENHF